MTTSEQRILNRPLALVGSQPLPSGGASLPRRGRREREPDANFLEFALEELDAMQQKVGELRFAIAAMTTLIKDRLERG